MTTSFDPKRWLVPQGHASQDHLDPAPNDGFGRDDRATLGRDVQATLPRLRGLFVVGTDTAVGKTLIAGAIARALRKTGESVEVFKPVASGCRKTPAGLISEDAEFLAWAAESKRTLAEIVPVRYAPAVAPNVAAERTKTPVDLDAIFDAYARLKGQADAVVVEGVGGLFCPITDDFWVIHFVKMTRLPVVIVARAGLGTINHTLLTLHAARSAGLNVAGVVVNRYEIETPLSDEQAAVKGDAVLAMHTNPQQIADRGKVKVLALVPDEAENSVADARIGPNTQFVIDAVEWGQIADRGMSKIP
ncbi:MAG: dethiobiotin synthase [Phycisphaerae bacterium]|nr:dethiobiotin synthase [Phycisphaerae bacterium]